MPAWHRQSDLRAILALKTEASILPVNKRPRLEVPLHSSNRVDVLAAAVDLLLTDPILARDAIYRPGDSGSGVPVRVVLGRPDRVGSYGETRIASETATLEVRRSEVPEPTEGDSFEVDGDRLLVLGEPLADGEWLVWNIEARPA